MTDDAPRDPDIQAAPGEPDIHEAARDVVDRLRDAGREEEQRSRAKRSFWRELPILILIAVVVAVVIKVFFFQAFFIPSGSMEDTLEINDRVLVNKLTYRFGDPQRGDVVVFDRREDSGENIVRRVVRNVAEAIGLITPRSDLIKRIIALPGETIEIRNDRVYIDGAALDEPYLAPGSFMPDYGPVTVAADAYFVMGDNRNFSRDSRVDGTVPRDHIVGKAFVILWPPSRWGGL